MINRVARETGIIERAVSGRWGSKSYMCKGWNGKLAGRRRRGKGTVTEVPSEGSNQKLSSEKAHSLASLSGMVRWSLVCLSVASGTRTMQAGEGRGQVAALSVFLLVSVLGSLPSCFYLNWIWKEAVPRKKQPLKLGICWLYLFLYLKECNFLRKIETWKQKRKPYIYKCL